MVSVILREAMSQSERTFLLRFGNLRDGLVEIQCESASMETIGYVTIRYHRATDQALVSLDVPAPLVLMVFRADGNPHQRNFGFASDLRPSNSSGDQPQSQPDTPAP